MKDTEYSRLVFDTCSLVVRNGLWTTTSYTNIQIPKVPRVTSDYYLENYPRHECKLDPLRQEFIMCKDCQSKLQMSRHNKRVTTRLVQSHSTYHPQPLKYCKCKSTALLVDHRGVPRVYNSNNSWQYIIQPLGYERRYEDFELDYQYIPKYLLDNSKRPRFIPEDTSRIPMKSSGIILKDINKSLQLSFIITPRSHIPNHSTSEHYLRYAYTYKIMIVTKYLIYLPSGISLAVNNPKVQAIVNQDYQGKSLWSQLGAPWKPKDNDMTNYLLELLNYQLSMAYQLPIVELEYYPSQTIGYLPIIPSDTQSWEFWKTDQWHANPTVINHLEVLKRNIAKVRSQVSFCKSDTRLMALWVRDNLNPKPLAIPPIRNYYLSRKLNSKYNLGVQ